MDEEGYQIQPVMSSESPSDEKSLAFYPEDFTEVTLSSETQFDDSYHWLKDIQNSQSLYFSFHIPELLNIKLDQTEKRQEALCISLNNILNEASQLSRIKNLRLSPITVNNMDKLLDALQEARAMVLKNKEPDILSAKFNRWYLRALHAVNHLGTEAQAQQVNAQEARHKEELLQYNKDYLNYASLVNFNILQRNTFSPLDAPSVANEPNIPIELNNKLRAYAKSSLSRYFISADRKRVAKTFLAQMAFLETPEQWLRLLNTSFYTAMHDDYQKDKGILFLMDIRKKNIPKNELYRIFDQIRKQLIIRLPSATLEQIMPLEWADLHNRLQILKERLYLTPLPAHVKKAIANQLEDYARCLFNPTASDTVKYIASKNIQAFLKANLVSSHNFDAVAEQVIAKCVDIENTLMLARPNYSIPKLCHLITSESALNKMERLRQSIKPKNKNLLHALQQQLHDQSDFLFNLLHEVSHNFSQNVSIDQWRFDYNHHDKTFYFSLQCRLGAESKTFIMGIDNEGKLKTCQEKVAATEAPRLLSVKLIQVQERPEPAALISPEGQALLEAGRVELNTLTLANQFSAVHGM